jgi:hypothetical protein
VVGADGFQVLRVRFAVTSRLPYRKFICTQFPGIVSVPTNDWYSSTTCGGTWNTVLLWPGAGSGRLLIPYCALMFMNPVNSKVQSLGGIGAPKPGVRPPGNAPTAGV